MHGVLQQKPSTQLPFRHWAPASHGYPTASVPPALDEEDEDLALVDAPELDDELRLLDKDEPVEVPPPEVVEDPELLGCVDVEDPELLGCVDVEDPELLDPGSDDARRATLAQLPPPPIPASPLEDEGCIFEEVEDEV